MRRGLAVRVRRTELEKKSTEVAFKVGISREYLRLIEAGKAKNPSIEVMKNLAAELQSDVQTLFFSFDED
jgi:putative transcriptional regulator